MNTNPNREDAERRPRILIVDDEPHNRELLVVMLTPEGVELETAASGEAALAMIARQPPDLVLLDIMMPGMDGYDVVTRLKSATATKSIPIIVVTALDDPQAKLRGLNAGAEDFLTKPIDRAELRVRVRNLLRLKAYGDFHDRHSQRLELEVGERTAALVDSERLYRSTFDAAPVGIVHVGLDGCWLRINQRLCEILGYTRDQLQRADVQQTLEPDPPSARQPLIDGAVDRQVAERRYRRCDGTFVGTRVNTSVYRDADGRPEYFIVVIEDITAQRMLEAQLRQAGKMDAIGRLASGVAHDFNNLLSVVVSLSELLADELGDGDPMRVDLEEIRAAGWRGVELTRQLLAFGRQQVLVPSVVNLTEIVVGMEKMLRRVLGEDVVLATDYAAPTGNVRVDPGQVEQVIMNLVVNARDAMPRGGTLVIETTEVILDAAFTAQHAGMSPGPHVMLAVRDSGTGIDLATQVRMFEPFFTTKEVGKGTGLGLATVFGIVRQSGGTISVTSTVGVGTQFKVYLPAVAGAAVSRPVVPRVTRPTLRGAETVLLVEDEVGVRNVASTILRKYGYDVLEAQSGGDALLLCEQHPSAIHMLLTDVVMPRMNGRQLAERLQQVRPEMRVLYMSGYMDDEVVRHGILDDSIAFIQKPITPESLTLKIRQTLAAPHVARRPTVHG